MEERDFSLRQIPTVQDLLIRGPGPCFNKDLALEIKTFVCYEFNVSWLINLVLYMLLLMQVQNFIVLRFLD